MSQHRVAAILCVPILSCITVGGADIVRNAMPWDVCLVVERKVSECGAGKKARPFADFLDPGLWQREPRDTFSGELQWDLTQAGEAQQKTVWRDVGNLGASKIRAVRYLVGEE